MECNVDVNWVLSLLWPTFWLFLVIKMDKANGFYSGLQDVFSTPIVSSAVIAVIYVYFTYELPASNDKGLIKLLSGFSYFLTYIKCSFVNVLSIWGNLLMYLAIYKFLKRNFPTVVEDYKNKLRNWWESKT